MHVWFGNGFFDVPLDSDCSDDLATEMLEVLVGDASLLACLRLTGLSRWFWSFWYGAFWGPPSTPIQALVRGLDDWELNCLSWWAVLKPELWTFELRSRAHQIWCACIHTWLKASPLQPQLL